MFVYKQLCCSGLGLWGAIFQVGCHLGQACEVFGFDPGGELTIGVERLGGGGVAEESLDGDDGRAGVEQLDGGGVPEKVGVNAEPKCFAGASAVHLEGLPGVGGAFLRAEDEVGLAWVLGWVLEAGDL